MTLLIKGLIEYHEGYEGDKAAKLHGKVLLICTHGGQEAWIALRRVSTRAAEDKHKIGQPTIQKSP